MKEIDKGYYPKSPYPIFWWPRFGGGGDFDPVPDPLRRDKEV